MSCETCGGSGWLRGDNCVRACECRRQSVRAQLLDRAGIPRRYQRATFDNLDLPNHRSVGEARMICRRFVDEWPTQRHRGLTLTGPVGVGKTHLVCAALIACADRWEAKISFSDFPTLFRRIKATFGNRSDETEDEILRPLLGADILALDDLGKERDTDWQQAMVEDILCARYDDDKSTILTSNYANRPLGWVGRTDKPVLVDMSENGGGLFARQAAALAPARRAETLGDRIGARAYSRVQEMTTVIEMDGEDQRAAAGRRRG